MTSVVALYIHPVKSLHRVEQDFLDLDPWGPSGDRRWLIIDAQGRFMTQRQFPLMAQIFVHPVEGGLRLDAVGRPPIVCTEPEDMAPLRDVSVWKSHAIPTRMTDDAISGWLSETLKTPCSLVYMADPGSARPADFGSVSFADGFPLLVTNTASLDDLNGRLEHPVPMERFRPNIALSHDVAWQEDEWTRLRIGEVEIELVKPCSRCIVTTIDQESGAIPVPREPLRTMTQFRHRPGGVMFGQNALVSVPGRIRRGDTVTVLA